MRLLPVSALLLAALLGSTSGANAKHARAPKVVSFAIDQGSSSTKAVGMDAKGRVVVDLKIGTTLGSKLKPDLLLPAANQVSGVDAMRTLRDLAVSYGIAPADIAVISTAAVRNAKGRVPVAARKEGVRTGRQYNAIEIRAGLGLTRAKVITGHQEAVLGYRGALLGVRPRTPKSTRYVVLDLGGGSQQVTVGSARRVTGADSVQVGSNKISEQLFTDAGGQPLDTVSPAQLAAADAAMPTMVRRTKIAPAQLAGATPVLTGTIGKLLAFHFGKRHVTRAQIVAFRAEVASTPIAQRGDLLSHTAKGKPLEQQQLEALGLVGPNAGEGVKMPGKLTMLLDKLDELGHTAPGARLELATTDARHILAMDQLVAKPQRR